MLIPMLLPMHIYVCSGRDMIIYKRHTKVSRIKLVAFSEARHHVSKAHTTITSHKTLYLIQIHNNNCI